ncbi:MAG: SufD family Fe-S cluster assembly protein [bacterium]
MNQPSFKKTNDFPEHLVIIPNEHLVIVENGREATGIRHTHIRVGRDSSLICVLLLPTTGELQRSITLELDAGARAELFGFIAGAGQGKLTLSLTELHTKGASWARTTVCGLLHDASSLHLQGLIAVHPSAHGSDGLFEARAMLLSDAARATIIPNLEIQARDVRATHRCAIGPLDLEQLFYLQTRGCTLSDARKLLVDGFVEQHLGRLSDASLRGSISREYHSLFSL